MSPPIYMRLVETLMNEYGYDYDSTPGVIEKYDLMFDPGNIVNVPEGPFNDDQFATGGRVGLQEGGEPKTYQDLVDDITASYPTDADSQTIQRPSPQVEALQNILGPQLASFLGTPISAGEGGQNLFGQTYGAFTPEAQGQNLIQQQAINQALQQAGLGATAAGQFDADTGELTGLSGLDKEGVAGFQPFLNQATKAANLAQTTKPCQARM